MPGLKWKKHAIIWFVRNWGIGDEDLLFCNLAIDQGV